MKQALCLRPLRIFEVIRISHLAFRTAQKKQKLTLVDKANILEIHVCGVRLSLELAEGYPDVFWNFIGDAAAIYHYQSKAI
jgi:isocitrate/isopropylmalate dehydrogenase